MNFEALIDENERKFKNNNVKKSKLYRKQPNKEKFSQNKYNT